MEGCFILLQLPAGWMYLDLFISSPSGGHLGVLSLRNGLLISVSYPSLISDSPSSQISILMLSFPCSETPAAAQHSQNETEVLTLKSRAWPGLHDFFALSICCWRSPLSLWLEVFQVYFCILLQPASFNPSKGWSKSFPPASRSALWLVVSGTAL